MIILCVVLVVMWLLFLFWFGQIHDDKNVDFIIILGAGLYGDRVSNSLRRRLEEAIKYASDHPCKIIVAGGQGKGETITEALAMKLYLVGRGIGEEDIIMENRSTSTYSNFLNTKEILGTNQLSLMVTTCDFHMFRAILIGKKIGFTCYRNPARSTQFKCIKYYVRELLCLIKYVVIKHHL